MSEQAGAQPGVPRPAPSRAAGHGEEADERPMSHWIAPVAVALIGAFMSILDSSIVNVAIPTIMNVFNVGTSDVQWVSTIYMLALGVVVPFSGWLGTGWDSSACTSCPWGPLSWARCSAASRGT